MRVKICGIKTREDAMAAIESGADALGFVFYKPSPRYISPDEAKRIVRSLPPFVEKVGLFVKESAAFIDEVCLSVGLGVAQLHWDIDENFLESIRTPALPVVRAKSNLDLNSFKDRYRLVDAFVEGYGGAGNRVNLKWFEGVDCTKIILAGGLQAKDLKELKPFGFYGVDVSSGVEKAKGVKDIQKIQNFIRAAKE